MEYWFIVLSMFPRPGLPQPLPRHGVVLRLAYASPGAELHRRPRVIWLRAVRSDNFQGLRTFKGKIDPVWEPCYLAASGWLVDDLALIDIAALIGGGMRVVTSRRAADATSTAIS